MKIKSIISKFRFDDSIINRFVKGAFWAVFGNVVVKGLSLLSSIFIARFLGNFSFGELSVIKTTLSVFSLMATFGLGLTVTKYIADKKKNNLPEIGKVILAANKITLFTGSFLGILIIIFSPLISKYILESENLIIPLRISGVFLFFNAMNVYQIGVLGGLEAFKKMARVNVIVGLFSFPVMIITTYFGGLNGALVGLTLGLIFNWFLNRKLINKEVLKLGIDQRDSKVSIDYIKKMLKFSYPLALSEGVYSVTNWLLIYLLLYKTNYGEVGIFNSANQWAQMILFLPGAISNVLLSFLSNQENDVKNYNKILKLNLIFNIGITLVFSILISVFSSFVFRLYGESFEGGEKVLTILVFSCIPMSVIGVLEHVYISKSKTGMIFIFKLIRQSILLLIAWIMFSFYKEASSLSISWLVGYIITALIMILYLFKKRILKLN
ncbi:MULTISPECIES: oligosaccharide flippase family protein [Aquimarina]|uniref:Oligosaccharide flippase family protein n=1 Tax=Aquimarina algiphila TaxID=2047982 RepID=A0A554VG14_9FLAO|nr:MULTISPECIES: oligosaccharide flippase family protein [Aquimarina]TSE06276.1 oligosaccharide flippase family protein [Aquimarina algiphila]